jgi:hypothetical protein
MRLETEESWKAVHGYQDSISRRRCKCLCPAEHPPGFISARKVSRLEESFFASAYIAERTSTTTDGRRSMPKDE